MYSLGAVGLASAAYGIGSAAGGGSATAEPDNTPTVKREFRLGPPPGFDDLADKLGVDEDELADAMRDFGEQEMGEHRDDFANALAKALGVSADKVAEAFDGIVEVHKVRIDERLAEELGVDADQVEGGARQGQGRAAPQSGASSPRRWRTSWAWTRPRSRKRSRQRGRRGRPPTTAARRCASWRRPLT